MQRYPTLPHRFADSGPEPRTGLWPSRSPDDVAPWTKITEAGPRRPARGGRDSRPAVNGHEQNRPRPRLPDQRRPVGERPRDRGDWHRRRPLGPQRLLVSHGVGLRDGRVRRRPCVAEPRAPHRLRPVPLEVPPRIGAEHCGGSTGRRGDRPFGGGPGHRTRPTDRVARSSPGVAPGSARARSRCRGRDRPRPRAATGAAHRGRVRRRRHLPPVEQARSARCLRICLELGPAGRAVQELPGRPESRPSAGRARLRTGSRDGDRSRHRDASLDTVPMRPGR